MLSGSGIRTAARTKYCRPVPPTLLNEMNRRPTKQMIGQRFGRLVVVESVASVKGHSYVLCDCDCGTTAKRVGTSALNTGSIVSCGCYHREIQKARCTTHGKFRTAEYRSYINAKGRCTNPNNTNYPNYGGRGIEFRFSNFEEFLNDIGPKPTPKHSVDRTNVDGHYEPGNVRWATAKEQANNRQANARTKCI